jgi:hypothetical protein
MIPVLFQRRPRAISKTALCGKLGTGPPRPAETLTFYLTKNPYQNYPCLNMARGDFGTMLIGYTHV